MLLGVADCEGTPFDRHEGSTISPLGGGSAAIRERKLEAECGALPQLGLQPDSPVHALDELPTDVEPESRAPDALFFIRIQPPARPTLSPYSAIFHETA